MVYRHAAVVALAFASLGAQAQSKQELANKVLQLQQAGFESIARAVVERPVMQLMQASAFALQTRVPPEKREATGKAIEADVRKFVEEAVPPLQKRAVELAPSTMGAELQEKFTEDELKALVAWLESPTNKKYQQLFPAMQNSYVQKLSAEAGTLYEAKLKQLQQKVQVTLAAAEKPAASAPAGAAPKK